MEGKIKNKDFFFLFQHLFVFTNDDHLSIINTHYIIISQY